MEKEVKGRKAEREGGRGIPLLTTLLVPRISEFKGESRTLGIIPSRDAWVKVIDQSTVETSFSVVTRRCDDVDRCTVGRGGKALRRLDERMKIAQRCRTV
jgi:hypothetical protein